MKGTKIMIAVLLAGAVMLNSCKKTETGAYSVRMTDDPGPYSQVNVDVRSVEVIGDHGTATLATHAGVYNLLDFANGVDTLIATGNLAVGNISQVRLILGSNNSILLNGTLIPITVPSGEESGLKLNIHQSVTAGSNTILLLDFDANQSIVAEGNGAYHLKPVLRVLDVDISTTGMIAGHISPPSTPVVVTVSGGGHVYSTVEDRNGYFKIKGLAAGTYSVTITPNLPLLPITIPNVSVSVGATSDLGLVAF
jgi:hypothetical protein